MVQVVQDSVAPANEAYSEHGPVLALSLPYNADKRCLTKLTGSFILALTLH